MDAPLSTTPAIFAGHFTAKVAATCTLISIAIFLLLVAPAGESGLLTPFGVCVLHALLAFIMLAVEHLYVAGGNTSANVSRVAIALRYVVNTGAATLPIVVLLYGQKVLSILTPGQ